MKRWLTHLLICSYLGALSFGLFSHAVGLNTNCHPAMYYIVWDMYCGWSAFESRLHVIGEGESGDYYELLPGPWGDVYPHGSVGRRQYDMPANHVVKMAAATLRHTRHEPIRQIIVVEEAWPKKYNFRDEVYLERYGEPKERQSYYFVRVMATPEGDYTRRQPQWGAMLSQQAVANNPRLMREATVDRTFFAIDPDDRNRSSIVPTSYSSPNVPQATIGR